LHSTELMFQNRGYIFKHEDATGSWKLCLMRWVRELE
jgi:hypothetical protein